ncbi:hypothetical protein [Ideonella dechloratans]|uniref:hypothetical protein n=1 Tax=Ideonella dechloratans TaxID=36863 RepID=UPI0035B4F6EC
MAATAPPDAQDHRADELDGFGEGRGAAQHLDLGQHLLPLRHGQLDVGLFLGGLRHEVSCRSPTPGNWRRRRMA